MKVKILVIGASTTGKTTLAQYLREHTDFTILETDEELSFLNGGNYPHDDQLKMNVLAPKMVADILGRESIVFFTNTHYFRPEDLRVARDRGFKVIQLELGREEMIKRNKNRYEKEGYDDLTSHFDPMEQYQKDIAGQGLVDRIIAADQPVEKIAAELLSL